MKLFHYHSSDESKQKTQEETKLTPTQKSLLASCLMVGVIVVLLFAWFTFRPDNKTNIHDYFSTKTVGELTTLECRYHNVSIYDKEGGFLGVGKQYVWFEYDVLIQVGIDVKQVRIEGPSDNGVIRIYLPPIQILGAKADENTIKKPVHEVALGADLTTDEETSIISAGVEKLRDDAKTIEIIAQARESAKDILEKYVIDIGELIGEDYTIEWIETSDNSQNTSTTE